MQPLPDKIIKVRLYHRYISFRSVVDFFEQTPVLSSKFFQLISVLSLETIVTTLLGTIELIGLHQIFDTIL